MIETGILGKLSRETRDAAITVNATCSDAFRDITDFAVKATDPSQISDYAQRKVVTAVNNFTKDLPLFEQAGFSLKCLELELGITPYLRPRFNISQIPSGERRNQLLDEARQRGGSTYAVLAALFKAVEMKRFLKLGDLELVGLNVTLSTIPSVRLVFE